MEIETFKDRINLTNNGKLQIFFIGTGSAFNKVDFQNNLLVIKGQDHVLIDCGTLFSYALKTYNTPLTKIRTILPTHSHSDHIGGLEEVAYTNFYVTRQKPSLIVPDFYKKTLSCLF